jgi:hypothetical protein
MYTKGYNMNRKTRKTRTPTIQRRARLVMAAIWIGLFIMDPATTALARAAVVSFLGAAATVSPSIVARKAARKAAQRKARKAAQRIARIVLATVSATLVTAS